MNKAKLTVCRFFVFLSVMVLLGGILTGCAGWGKTPLKSSISEVSVNDNSIMIFSLRTSNSLAPKWQPFVIQFKIEGDNGFEKYFKVKDYYDFEEDVSNFYLLSAELPPGSYRITKVNGNSEMSFLSKAMFFFQTNVSFDIAENSITYIGRIDIVNRLRTGDEPRSGPVIPFPLQQTAGFSNGTCDVTVTDESAEDIKLFKAEYPALEAYDINVSIGTR